MSVLLQLRLWLRRASSAEKRAALGAVALVVAIAGWAVVPTGHHGGSDDAASVEAGGATGPATTTATSLATTATTAAAAAATPAAASPSGSASTGGAASAVASTSGAPAANPACVAGSTDQGVTATTIHIGVGTVDIEGAVGNTAFKVRGDQTQIINAIVDDINKNGGIRCRKVIVSFYKENPLDQTEQHDTCLQMVQDKLFAVIDGGGFVPSSNRDCLAQNHIPIFAPAELDPPELSTYSPYVFSWYDTSLQGARNDAYGAQALGLVDRAKGFKKAALLEESCFPPIVYKTLEDSLGAVGVSGGDIDKVVLQCGSGNSPPSAADITTAVLHNKGAGANLVFAATDPITLDAYTQIAQQQNFRPRYATSDIWDQIGAQGNVNPTNFDGAIGFTASRTGSLNAGLPLDPGTKRCSDIGTSHGLRGYQDESFDSLLGAYCSSLWLFQAAATHGTSLTRASLGANLALAGNVQLAAPAADAAFGARGKTWGGDFIRPVQFHGDCACWKVVSPAWRKPF